MGDEIIWGFRGGKHLGPGGENIWGEEIIYPVKSSGASRGGGKHLGEENIWVRRKNIWGRKDLLG